MRSLSRPTRRRFLQRAVVAAGALGLGANRPCAAEPGPARLRFGVLGINHEHIFRMVQAVRDGGGELAMVFADEPDPIHGAKFLKQHADVRRARTEDELLDAPDITLVVSAVRPAERASVGVRVMHAGKDFLADKGGFLNLEDLAAARRAQAATGRRYFISYNERLLLPVSVKIDELLQAGAIGRVTLMEGVGPHGLFGHGPREPWFWTRAGRGGILADVGAHQADQFLHYVGGERAEVVAAETGNFENSEHPEFEDYGHVVWRSTAGVGEATVTFDRGPSTTGFLLTLEGSEGRMEVRKHAGRISVLSRSGAKKEYAVDPKLPCPFGPRLVDDVLHRTETAQLQEQAFLASELAVRAQLAAVRTSSRPAKPH